jgi:hypothetical protein
MPVENISLENPVELSRSLVLNFKPQLFMSTRFTPITHSTKSFLIDVQKKTRQISPFVRDDLPGTNMSRDGYETLSFTPPHMAPERNLTNKDLEQRVAGDNVVEISADNASPEARATALMQNDMLDLEESNERARERMACEALSTGKNIINGEGYDNLEIAQPIPSDNIITLSGTSLFSSASSDPIAKLREFRRKITRVGGLGAGDAVFGSNAWDAFVSNSKVQAYLDKLHMTLGNIAPTPDQTFPGVTFQGIIEGVPLYTYDEFYFDTETKADKPMIPVDRMILIGSGCRMEMHYAAIYDGALGTVNKTQSYAYTWITEGKPRAKHLCVESAPLPVVVNGGGVISAKVI